MTLTMTCLGDDLSLSMQKLVSIEVNDLSQVNKLSQNTSNTSFTCTNGDFYLALGSSTGLALLVWVGGGLLKQVLCYFGNDPSLGQKSPILHLPPIHGR